MIVAVIGMGWQLARVHYPFRQATDKQMRDRMVKSIEC
jgi:hypothetical protein